MTNEAKEKLLMTVKNTTAGVAGFITAQRMKKALALLVAAGFISAGGAYFVHQQKAMAKAQERQIETKLAYNLAEQNHVKLLSADAVKGVVADTLSVAADDIVFKAIFLDVDDDDYEEHYKKAHKSSKNIREKQMRTNTYAYEYKVVCTAGDMRYKFKVDAETGRVLKSEVKKAIFAH